MKKYTERYLNKRRDRVSRVLTNNNKKVHSVLFNDFTGEFIKHPLEHSRKFFYCNNDYNDYNDGLSLILYVVLGKNIYIKTLNSDFTQSNEVLRYKKTIIYNYNHGLEYRRNIRKDV